MKAYLSFVYLAFPLGERFSLTSGPTVMASPHPQWPARQRWCRGFAGMSLPSAATPQYPTQRLIYDQNGVINTLLMAPLRPAHCKGRCRVLLFYFISTFFCFVNWSSKLFLEMRRTLRVSEKPFLWRSFINLMYPITKTILLFWKCDLRPFRALVEQRRLVMSLSRPCEDVRSVHNRCGAGRPVGSQPLSLDWW